LVLPQDPRAPRRHSRVGPQSETVFLFSSAIALAGPSVTQIPIGEVGWSVSFISVVYDPQADTTTFRYALTALGSEKDLSHWVLADSCGEQIPVGSGSLTSFGLDPTTGVYGFKWDDGQPSGTTAEYTVTLQGNVAPVEVEYSVKGGTYFAVGKVTGPGCTVPPAQQSFSLSGTAHVDVNRNNLLENGEPLLANVAVQLIDGGGNIVGTVMSDAFGTYSFTNLVSGNYSVQVPAATPSEDFNESLAQYFQAVTALPRLVSITGADVAGVNLGWAISTAAVLDDFNPADPDADGFTFTGTGKTIGFWKHQLSVAIKMKGRAQVDPVTLSNYLIGVEALYIANPFDFGDATRYRDAEIILSDTSSDAAKLLAKQLLGTELNHVAGQGLTGSLTQLQGVLIAWAEVLVHDAASYSRADLLAAKDICDYINNTGQ
jgi:hypothetical protein